VLDAIGPNLSGDLTRAEKECSTGATDPHASFRLFHNGKRDKVPNYPETFEEAREWVKVRERETGVAPKTVANPVKGLLFDLENSTITRAVRDEDNNLVEMTYCAVTGSVLRKKITKACDDSRANP
jgi:hypothetical protein